MRLEIMSKVIEKRLSFEIIREYSIKKREKAHKRARALILWSKKIKVKAINSLRLNIEIK